MRISDWSSDVCSSDLGTLRDSLVVLALLLEQETEPDPLEIMTDTAAYSDAIFGLFWLLGYRFSPRLADIGGAKLWRIDRQASYGQFRSEEHTSELQPLMRISYSVFCLTKKNRQPHEYMPQPNT